MILIPDGEPLGPVGENQIEAVYARLGELRLELDANPLEAGPGRLNEKIALARTHLSICEDVFAVVSQALHRYRRALRAADTDYKLQYRALLTSDVEVRGGRAASDREAIAATRLRTEVAAIEMLKGAVEDLDAVMAVVKAKREDLKDLQRRLKDQQQMCREEIALGGRWGSAPRSGATVAEAARAHADAEIHQLMDSLIKKDPRGEPEGEPPPSRGHDADYEEFFAIRPVVPAQPELPPEDDSLLEVLSAISLGAP